ncbi:ZF316 protein, partial [Campylorhamphus procurvoides]|nr:ZF316 protein [Campylorhamphus procurvoides]
SLWQAPVTFEDVTVFLSRAEWDLLPVGHRELYRDVVLDTYELLTSLGYPRPKPDILYRLERGEEPWI